MFYEKLAEAKREKRRGERNRLDDLGFNVAAGMLAHKGLKRGLDASAFSRMNERTRTARSQLKDIIAQAQEVGATREEVREAMKKVRTEDYSDIAATETHNPFTRLVDKMSGATNLRDEYKKHKAHKDVLRESYAKGTGDYPDDAVRVTEAAQKKMRSRRLLGRRVAHGVGLGAALLGANKLRNMYNARKQRKDG